MSENNLTSYRQTPNFYKSRLLLTKHNKRSFLQVKLFINTKMSLKYSCTPDQYNRILISRILNKKSSSNALYQEFLLLIDDQEFLSKFYPMKNAYTTFAYLVAIFSFLVKDYPNYLSLGRLYYVMLINLLNKQRLINNSYERMIDAYKSSNKHKDSYNNFFDSVLSSDDGKNSYYKDKYVQRIFYNNNNPKDDDSIGSVETLIGFIEKKGMGLIMANNDTNSNNGGMNTPRKKMANQNRRRSSLLSILKKKSYAEMEKDSKGVKDRLEHSGMKDEEGSESIYPFNKLLSFHKMDSSFNMKMNMNNMSPGNKKNTNSKFFSPNKMKTMMMIQPMIKPMRIPLEVQHSAKPVPPITPTLPLSSLPSAKTKIQFVKTSVFLDKLRSNKKKIKLLYNEKNESIEKQCRSRVKTEPNMNTINNDETYLGSKIEKIGLFFSGNNIFQHMAQSQVNCDNVFLLPSLRIKTHMGNHRPNRSYYNSKSREMPVNIKASLYRAMTTNANTTNSNANDKKRLKMKSLIEPSFNMQKKNWNCQPQSSSSRTNHSLPESISSYNNKKKAYCNHKL